MRAFMVHPQDFHDQNFKARIYIFFVIMKEKMNDNRIEYNTF